MHEWRNDSTCTKMATESQLRGQRSQKEPGATSLTHEFTSGSSLPRRYLKHMCELVDLFAGDGRRKKTFISMAGWVFFFIIHFFSLSTARRPVWWPVTRVNVFFFFFFLIATLDCRETLKTSLNPRQNLASCSVGGRFQNCDGFMGKAEWVSQPSSAQRPLFIDVIRASLRGSCVCLPLVL